MTDLHQAKIDALAEDVKELRTTMRELASAMVQLAKVEERQSIAMTQIQRGTERDDDHEKRLTMLESQMPAMQQQGNHVQLWIDRVLWAAMAGGLGWLAAGMPGA